MLDTDTKRRIDTARDIGKTGNADAGSPGRRRDLIKEFFLTPRLK